MPIPYIVRLSGSGPKHVTSDGRTIKEDLNTDDRLVAKNVYIIYPCDGTGAYLVEVQRGIAANVGARQPRR